MVEIGGKILIFLVILTRTGWLFRLRRITVGPINVSKNLI
jgi:hypothetical protein